MAPQPQGLTLEQKQAIARARAKAAAQKAGVIPAQPASADAPNPIIAAQRASQTQAMSDWAKQQEAEKRHKAELAAMNAASPIPFKDTGPGGAIELNQERPDLLGTRAFGQAVNANIGTVNSGIDMAGKMGVAYGAGLDPSVQGALAGMEYYRGEGDAPERLATAVQQSGAAQQMQQLNERGDVVPRIPIPEAKTAGEVGADIAGTLAGYLLGPGKGINATARGVSREVGAVPGLSRTVRGVGGEAVENAAHAYAFGSSVAPEGADRNMAGLGVATDPLSYIGIEAIRAVPRGVKALGNALKPADVPTNAGGANLAPAAVQPPPSPLAQPSIAPIPQPTVSNAPRRGAQPAAPGAGQGAGPPTLQATPTTPPASPALAGSDRKIIGRLLRAGGVPRDDVDRVLTGLVVAHQGSDSARLPLAFFAEEYLPTVLPKQTAEDVIQKLRGFGRERYGANDPKDPSRSIVRGTINELRGSQRETLTNQFEGLLGKETLMTKQGKITRDKQGVAEAVYAEEIGRQQRLLDEGRARPEQVAARDDLLAFMSRKDYFDQIPPEVKLKAADEGKDLWEYVTQNPLEAAHWLQSQLGVLARKGNTIAEAMRMPIVRRIEASVDGYRGARMEYGDLSGQQAALEFGDDLYRVAGSKFSTDQKALEFKKLSRAQKTVAKKSLRDKLLNEFRKAKTGDDQAAVITAMQKDGVLDALETILGPEGKQVADAIRGMVRENERLRAIDLQAGSNTADNLAQMRAAQEAVRSPVNRAVGSIGDESSVARTVFADAVSVALGLPPVWTAGKLGAGAIGKFGAPSRKKLASATRTLYELPRNAGTAAPETAPRRTPAARGPRRQELAAPTQENLDELLKQYDQTPTPALRNKIIAMRRKMNLPATQNGDEGFAGVGPLSAMAGGAGGYLGAQDINGDGTIDAGERAAFTVGGAAGGYAASRMLPKPKTRGAPTKPPAAMAEAPKAPPAGPAASVSEMPGQMRLASARLKDGSTQDVVADVFTDRGVVVVSPSWPTNAGDDLADALVGRSNELRGPRKGLKVVGEDYAPNTPREPSPKWSSQNPQEMADLTKQVADRFIGLSRNGDAHVLALTDEVDANSLASYLEANIPSSKQLVATRDGGEIAIVSKRWLRDNENRFPSPQWDQLFPSYNQGKGLRPAPADWAAQKAPPASPSGAPTKPPKGEGPGIVSRMVTGGVIGGIAGSAGSADPQTPETMALLQQTQQERAGVLQEIASLENALKIFSTGTNEDIQRQLIREGFDLGTTGPNRDGVDGNIGDATKAAIRGRKQDISNSLTAARDRLTAADGRIKELEDRAAFEEAQPPEWKKGAREVAPWIGSVLGATFGYRGRSGAVRKAGPKAAATIAKADALLTPGPVRKGKSAADRAAFKQQFANINDFWQMGGAGDKVPFEVTAKGDFKSRPKASIMPPTKLYRDKRFKAADYANMGVGVGEAAAAQFFVMNAEAKVKEAEQAVKDNASVANIKALEAAKDELALAQAARSAGLLYAGSRLAGSFKQPYPSSRPNVRAADAERAMLLEAMKK